MDNNQKKSNPLERLSDEEVLLLLNSGSYSANVRWEAIRRKIATGDYDPDQSGKDSLYMLNRLAFYSELNKKNKLLEDAELLIRSDVSEVAGSVPEPEEEREVELKQAGEKVDVVAEAPSSELVLSDSEIVVTLDSPEYPSVQTLKPPHKHFAASPFLKWIKSFDPAENTETEESAEKEAVSISSDLKEVEKTKKKRRKNQKNKKSKKDSKGKLKSDKNKNDLSLNPEIISETLADLLAEQGHFKEADEMYRQLGIKYPEKSSYFASKLKKS